MRKWHPNNAPKFFTATQLEEAIPDKRSGGILGTLSVTYKGNRSYEDGVCIEISGGAEKIKWLREYLDKELSSINGNINQKRAKKSAIANADPKKPSDDDDSLPVITLSQAVNADSSKIILHIKVKAIDCEEDVMPDGKDLFDVASALNQATGFLVSEKFMQNLKQRVLINDIYDMLRNELRISQMHEPNLADAPESFETPDSLIEEVKIYMEYFNSPQYLRQELEEISPEIYRMADIAMKGYYSDYSDEVSYGEHPGKEDVPKNLPLPNADEIQYIKDLRDEIIRVQAEKLGIKFIPPEDNPVSWQDREAKREGQGGNSPNLPG